MARKNVLLVEGLDDIKVIGELLEYHKVPEIFAIKQKGGDSNLKQEAFQNILDTLDTEIDGSGLEKLGIVIDADTELSKRWDSLSQLLRSIGYRNVPKVPDPQGTIVKQADRPTVGIWLMPDNQLPGMLENFIEFLVPPNDTLWQRAKKCLDEIPQNEQPFRPQHKIKAQVHTWLAWKEQPGKPLGQAIKMRYLDADLPQAQQFISWIQLLFNS